MHQLGAVGQAQLVLDPGPVRIAVISGVDTGAADSSAQRRRTLWGELAWQLGRSEGYRLVAEGPRNWTARFQMGLGYLLKGPLNLHQSAVTCDGDGFHAAENVQLREDVVQVPFHRGLADEKVRADFFVALATREQGQQLQLPAGQGFVAHACCQLFNQCLRYAGSVAAHFPDTIQQFFASSVF